MQLTPYSDSNKLSLARAIELTNEFPDKYFFVMVNEQLGLYTKKEDDGLDLKQGTVYCYNNK